MMMLLFLLPLLALAYVCWHVWLLLPLSWGWKILVVLLMVGAFMLLFASIFRATDRLPMQSHMSSIPGPGRSHMPWGN